MDVRESACSSYFTARPAEVAATIQAVLLIEDIVVVGLSHHDQLGRVVFHRFLLAHPSQASPASPTTPPAADTASSQPGRCCSEVSQPAASSCGS